MVGQEVINLGPDHGTLNAMYFFSPLATSADRFYRIDRSQVSFLEPTYESEKFPSKDTLLVADLKSFYNINAETFTDFGMVLIA